jgi:hypothetical protein
MTDPAARRGGDPVHGLVVLGMHRSGTSAATRMLNLLGLHLCTAGDLMCLAPGHSPQVWESSSIARLNDDLLERAGRTWWCPPARPADGDPVELAAAFRKVFPDRPWVFKDPRLALTFPAWRQALGNRFGIVVMLRKPVDVALSLKARDHIPVPGGVALWERYNRLIAAHAGGLPALVTTYDSLVNDPAGWSRNVIRFQRGLNLAAPRAQDVEAACASVRPDLRHAHDSRAPEYPSATSVYQALLALTGFHESFVSPDLDPEHPWIEGEFSAHGYDLRSAFPHLRLRTTVSVIVQSQSEDPLAVSQRLKPWLSPDCELIVVAEAGRPVTAAAGTVNARVVPAERGATSGAQLNAGAAAATADIFAFWPPRGDPAPAWRDEVLEAFATGYATAGRPSCLAVDRRVFTRVGGFDPAQRTFAEATSEFIPRAGPRRSWPGPPS